MNECDGRNEDSQTERVDAARREEVQAEASRIIDEGKGVGTRIKNLVLSAVQGSEKKLSAVPGVVFAVAEGVITSVKGLLPAERAERVDEVFSGLEEAIVSLLNSLTLTLSEAKSRGEKIAEEDFAELKSELSALQTLFLETLATFQARFGSELKEQGQEIQQHLSRIMMKVLPAFGALQQALLEFPQELLISSVKHAGSMVARVLRTIADSLDTRDGSK